MREAGGDECRCEWDHAGALGSKENDRGQKRYEDDDNVAYRDLVVAGTASGFDLVKALLCSFGLDTASERFEPASNQGALHLDDRAKGVYVHDVLRANDGGFDLWGAVLTRNKKDLRAKEPIPVSAWGKPPVFLNPFMN